MATQTTTLLPVQNRNGTINSATIDVPAGITRAEFRVTGDASTYTDPNLAIALFVEQSFDGGASWEQWFGGGSSGGATNKLGQPTLPIIAFNPMVDDGQGGLVWWDGRGPRRGRGRMVIAGGPFRCGVDVVVTT